MILRYNGKTGLVNLMGEFIEQIPIKGMEYLEVDEMVEWDDTKHHIYVKNGKIVLKEVE